FEEEPQEEPEEDVEEDPKEDLEEGPEEDPEAEAKNDVPLPATTSVGSPITPPPLSESSSDVEDDALVIKNEPLEMPPTHSNKVEHRVTDLENREQERNEEMVKALVFERLGWGAWDARPGVGNDGPISFGEPKPPKPIMPPKMMKRKAVNKMVKKRIDDAIEEYERTRVDLGNASGSRKANTGGPVTVQGCSHKTFMNGKPHPFNGTEGLVNANRKPWVEFKSMMNTEYCLTTEIQRMEEELWTLTLKKDDIE
nr:hypothetical protein [Tanacetum cinerariifolium]